MANYTDGYNSMFNLNRLWGGVVNYAGRAYPSCIDARDAVRLADGAAVRAGDIPALVRRGERLDFLTEPAFTGQAVDGLPPVRNPIIAAVMTAGQGYALTFEGGRSVRLTGAHRLPAGPARYESVGDWPCRIQPRLRADEVHAGDVLEDGRVVSVRPLGLIKAVRIWTAFPAWITTAAGLTIGTRWHEQTSTANGIVTWAHDGEDSPFGLDVPEVMDIVTYYDERGRDGGSLHIRHYGPAPAAQAIVALQEVCESAAEAATGPRIINRGRSVAPMWWRAETVGDYATAGFATASILGDVAAVPGIEPIAFDRRRLAA